MSTPTQQTDREKWEALAKAIGWELVEGGRICTVHLLKNPASNHVYDIQEQLRDSILAAIERTPLEKAAPKMAEMIMDEFGKQVCSCRVCLLVGRPVPCRTCQKRELLKEAGVIA